MQNVTFSFLPIPWKVNNWNLFSLVWIYLFYLIWKCACRNKCMFKIPKCVFVYSTFRTKSQHTLQSSHLYFHLQRQTRGTPVLQQRVIINALVGGFSRFLTAQDLNFTYFSLFLCSLQFWLFLSLALGFFIFTLFLLQPFLINTDGKLISSI